MDGAFVKVFLFDVWGLDGARLDGLMPFLDGWRRDQCARIANPIMRAERICSHLLVKFAFSRMTGKSPFDLRISSDCNGRPFSPSHPDFHFSISHSKGRIAVALSPYPIAVDIERIRDVPHGFPKRVLSEKEMRAYIGSGRDPKVFLVYWTRKECLVKITGSLQVGLSEVDCFGSDSAFVTSMRDGHVISLLGNEAENALFAVVDGEALAAGLTEWV